MSWSVVNRNIQLQKTRQFVWVDLKKNRPMQCQPPATLVCCTSAITTTSFPSNVRPRQDQYSLRCNHNHLRGRNEGRQPEINSDFCLDQFFSHPFLWRHIRYHHCFRRPLIRPSFGFRGRFWPLRPPSFLSWCGLGFLLLSLFHSVPDRLSLHTGRLSFSCFQGR